MKQPMALSASEKKSSIPQFATGGALGRRYDNIRGSGSLLSRSQDGLDGRLVTTRRKNSAIAQLSSRPQSSLGIPRVSTAPQSINDDNSTTISVDSTVCSSVRGSKTIANRRMTPVQADARINKTKITVTELQKTKNELEVIFNYFYDLIYF